MKKFQADNTQELIRDNPEVLPSMIEYYHKNSKRLDELTKIIIINSLFKNAFKSSMIFDTVLRKPPIVS